MECNMSRAYQYLQRSKLPTNKFQKSLPRLKIPSLDKSCQRYLAALEPVFCDHEQYKEAVQSLSTFQQGPAKELHNALLQYDKTVKHSSYINEFWFNMYLSSRVPLPLNYNPFLAYRDSNQASLNDQLVRSTNFLISAIRFKRALEENLLKPEVFHLNPKKVSPMYEKVLSLTPEAIATYVSFAFKAFPLDMSQYNNLFNSTRIPKRDRDEILKSDPRQNRHILVLRQGEFYIFDILDENGDLQSPEYIFSNLRHIASQPEVKSDSLSITELTTADRNFWAAEREHLVSLSGENMANLSLIDSSIFALCLDDLTFEQDQIIEGAHNHLHGANQNGPTNRWFDKSLSLIVTKDGHSSVNFEHSWGDGVAILRFFNDTFEDTTKNPQLTMPPTSKLSGSNISTRRLDFQLDARLKESIAISRKKHLEVTSNLELGKVQYAGLNRNYFKKNKLSPDSMSQLAFQIAFQKVYNQVPVTYESCSTAAFRGGRTETVRPCTNETKEATRAIIKSRGTSGSLSHSELKGLLQKCSQKHFQLCKEASMGDGFDRHLFALKEIALRKGMKIPEFFLNPIYQQNQSFTLSTSTLYGECFSGGGFAPVVADGFGLGYGYVDEDFGVLVSSYKNHRNNNQFVQALEESLTDIRKIVEV